MPENNLIREVHSALESRKSPRKLKDLFRTYGENPIFDALNELSGDLPDSQNIRKTALALDRPEADLRTMAESSRESQRRIARLILLETGTGLSDDPLLQKGLSDISAVIRTDTARFTGTGTDRTRVYNHLIRLIREDPDIRVRRAAGKRLIDSFADLYSVDFSGLPPLSQMLFIDALEGHSRIDEERVESLLHSDDAETAFRAGRTLQKWGTLKQRFQNIENASIDDTLKIAASLGVADYLENVIINDTNRNQAIELAKTAGRNDLVSRFTEGAKQLKIQTETTLKYFSEIQNIIDELLKLDTESREQEIKKLPLDNPVFREAVESAFPEKFFDRTFQLLFEMARIGQWENWTDRIVTGLSAGDPELTISAIDALAVIDREAVLRMVPPMLADSTNRIRRSAARALASITSEEGILKLVEYLKGEPPEEEKLESVYSGISDAGGTAPVRCILGNTGVLSSQTIGKLLDQGIDEHGVKLLAEGFTDTGDLAELLKYSGYKAGFSILSAWPALEESTRKHFLSSLAAAEWGYSIPRENNPGLQTVLKQLSREERTLLLEPVHEITGGKHRRYIHKLMKN